MNFKEKLKDVKAFAFDVDGVLSSDNIYLHPAGEIMRTMNIKDGYALQYAVKKSYPVAIITGGNSEAVLNRFKNLGITDVYLKARDKREALDDFVQKYDLKYSDILYMGDDIPDINILKLVGIPTCPLDAAEEVKRCCIYISDNKGGEGCARDVLEQVLRLHNEWLDEKCLHW
jgi:3-deoxy-D-manno-octulosonate 8-phosphate phosphatase (KDO 8-P phosphatase)